MNKIQLLEKLRGINEFSTTMSLSVADVITLVEDLKEEKPKLSLKNDLLYEFSENLTNEIVESELIDDYEFSLCGREIEVDSVSFNEIELKHIIQKHLNLLVEEILEDIEMP
jgi:hypothetical protein